MMPGGTILRGSWWFGRGSLDWPTAADSMVTQGDALALRPTADGPLSMGSANGTLGELVLPSTLAVDDGLIWLIDRRHGHLRRFDPIGGRFILIAGYGAASTGAQWFGPRAAIAATAGLVAIADPDRSDLLVLDSTSLVLSAVLGLGVCHPISVAAHHGRFYVLDDAGVIHTTTDSMDRLEPLNLKGRRPRSELRGSWSRIAVDADGSIYLVDESALRWIVSSADGTPLIVGDEPDEVRDRFDQLPLNVDWRRRFEVPEWFNPGGSGGGHWFDEWGDPTVVRSDDSLGPARFAASGAWTSDLLDSGQRGCRWHRIGLSGRTPPGCTVAVSTFASDERVEPDAIPPGAWSRPIAFVGPAQPQDPASSAIDTDIAVLARRGRFLSVRIELRGDGWSTPSVDELLVEPERPGLERFLPATYRSDEEAAEFLHRFLSIFDHELDSVEQQLRGLPARFSPTGVPEPWLNTLAAELGVPLEREWNVSQRRQLLEATPRTYPRRGTPSAIRSLLHAHLEASAERPVPPAIPVIIEGFRERHHATLGSNRLPLGDNLPIWSGDMVERPRLGTPGYHDRIRLVSVGTPQTDRFRAYANRFKVVVPRPLVPDSKARARFERLVVAEKPAHIAHEIVVVEPRTVIGEQSALGVDTFVGSLPIARLAACGDGCAIEAEPRLGTGLVLGSRRHARDRRVSVGHGARVSAGTVLI